MPFISRKEIREAVLLLIFWWEDVRSRSKCFVFCERKMGCSINKRRIENK
jgi:hypothetical protein